MAKSPLEILRDFETDGMPSSGPHKVIKRDFREYLIWLEGQIGEGGGGGGADWSDDIAAIDAKIDAEIISRGAGDTTLQGYLDGEAAARAAADNAEAISRAAGDATLQGYLNAEAAARIAADNAEAAARVAADNAEAAARVAADNSRFKAHDRVGDASEFFTITIPGSGSGSPEISSGSVVVNASGSAYRIAHNGNTFLVAARRDMPVEDGLVYALRFALRRHADTDDPYGDGLEFGIGWLRNDKTLLSQERIDLRSLLVSQGLLTVQRTISIDQDADITPPAGARYMRPYIRMWGSGGSTDIEAISRWETKGLPGPTGDTGDKGWAVEPETVHDGPDRVVLRVADFIGGQGDKPIGTGKFIGIGGLVDTAAEAINVKGNEGAQGPRGVNWRGAWEDDVQYYPGDLVTDPDADDNTAIWIALTENTDTKPFENVTHWAFFPGSFSSTLDDGLITDPVTDELDDGLITDPA